uniref:Dehydrogenase/reductase SDR family member 11 n=1 Tax=Panthera leo TaxID=9689 RepID=A0A8C8WTB2_PANLE
MARTGMEQWRDRLALVTGASGGIGAAVARALVQQGLKVVGCARPVSNIEVSVRRGEGPSGRRCFRWCTVREAEWSDLGCDAAPTCCSPKAICNRIRL